MLTLKDGGIRLTRQWQEAARKAGVEVRYQSAVVRLLGENGGDVTGVRVKGESGE